MSIDNEGDSWVLRGDTRTPEDGTLIPLGEHLAETFARIATLEAENDRQMQAGYADAALIHQQNERIATLEALVKEAGEALEELFNHRGGHHSRCVHYEAGGCDCDYGDIASQVRATLARIKENSRAD